MSGVNSFVKLLGDLIDKLNKAARPYLTMLVATLFNSVCAYMTLKGKLTPIEYITAVGPTNAMIIGFWFGERAALKPGFTDTEGSK